MWPWVLTLKATRSCLGYRFLKMKAPNSGSQCWQNSRPEAFKIYWLPVWMASRASLRPLLQSFPRLACNSVLFTWCVVVWNTFPRRTTKRSRPGLKKSTKHPPRPRALKLLKSYLWNGVISTRKSTNPRLATGSILELSLTTRQRYARPSIRPMPLSPSTVSFDQQPNAGNCFPMRTLPWRWYI